MKSAPGQENGRGSEAEGELEGSVGRAGGAGRPRGRPTRDAARASRCSWSWRALTAQIQAARVQGSGDVSELARRRGDVKREFDRAQEQALQESGSSIRARIARSGSSIGRAFGC